MKHIINVLVWAGLVGSLTTLSHAGIKDYVPSFVKPQLAEQRSKLNNVYAGVGMTNQLMHFNGEWVNDYSIMYAKVGSYFNGDQELGALAGIRFPYYLTQTDPKGANGYYFGFHAGQIENVQIDGKYKQRLGVGMDFSYVLLNESRISTATVGVSLANEMKRNDGTKLEVQPRIQLGYSLSFGLF